ncbi:MFS transporter [Bacillus atrophaeus]|uniref:Efflux transporter n=1 Tax=Bacillus atrophaeus (strain 1942) TaxID=720555 RepID=A0ABN3ZE88_BACA1|nr:MFS transporter [Bacillus atrophaeus]AMR61293.1 MFS transporter [Bacillus subtilis subsp. globigii]ADP34015.1 putative efflux transporter [Bacillus atrophaeus 1942]AIK46665.1 sugar (and other) transporter family protein [Bacillus atrophaeus subsp. globigii]EIM10969.1 putative efflux transporter [Bacillus atrophaeus C89]KFK81841.1 sugar (and other) transporter family protein [Bacillus atrophaeus]
MGSRKEWALIVSLLLGAILVPINSTMIAVALSSISNTYDESLASITWVVTVYLIVMAVTQPIAGKLGDMYGNKTMYLWGVGLFLIASLGCALSPSLLLLNIFRALQAVGGALLTPNSIAIIRHVVSEKRLPKVFGFFGLGAGLGAALGPFIGSILIDSFSWHSIFWVNIPFLAIALFTAMTMFPKYKEKKSDAPLDIIGSALLAVSIISIILLTKNAESWGYLIYGLLILLFVPLFFRWELRTKHPVIDLSLFKNSTFTNANLSVMLSNLMMYAVLLIMPLFMTSQFGLETSKSGMALSVFSIFMSASNWVGAQLHNKWGARKVIFLSFAMMAGANILFLLLSQSHSIVFLMVSLILGGLASGVGLTSMQVSSLSTVDAGMSGTASGIFSTFRYFGSITSSALIGLISGFHILFIILIGVSVIGIFVSLGIKPAETASVQKNSA